MKQWPNYLPNDKNFKLDISSSMNHVAKYDTYRYHFSDMSVFLKQNINLPSFHCVFIQLLTFIKSFPKVILIKNSHNFWYVEQESRVEFPLPCS